MKHVAPLVALLVVMALTACGPFRSATSTPQPSPLLTQLDAGEAKWRSADVNNYRIVVVEARSTIAPSTQAYTITVRGGQVVEMSATCRSGSCGPTFKAEEYTVTGLFARARGAAGNAQLETRLTLDPMYGFPASLATAIRGSADASGSIQVEQFQPLQ